MYGHISDVFFLPREANTLRLELVKILQELAESEPEASLKEIISQTG